MWVPVAKSTIKVCRTLVPSSLPSARPSSLPSARPSSPLSTHPSSPPSSRSLGDSVGAWRMLRLRNYLTPPKVCKSENNAKQRLRPEKKKKQNKNTRDMAVKKKKKRKPSPTWSRWIYLNRLQNDSVVTHLRATPPSPSRFTHCDDATKVAVNMLYYWQWK